LLLNRIVTSGMSKLPATIRAPMKFSRPKNKRNQRFITFENQRFITFENQSLLLCCVRFCVFYFDSAYQSFSFLCLFILCLGLRTRNVCYFRRTEGQSSSSALSGWKLSSLR
jgi:hypothetical protein